MAHRLVSPGLFSDEEAAVSPVLESTADRISTESDADIRRALLPDFSAISADQEQVTSDDQEKIKVFARIRPLKLMELENQEDQGCVCIDNAETLLLKAPKDSFTMKNTERGIGQAVHKFTFSKIFGPEVSQEFFFEGTMKKVVQDVLNGQNWLVYTYGVTNSGKTYTIQGSGSDGGILPRSLTTIFNSIGTRLYRAMNLKPFLSSQATWLDSKQVCQEEAKKQVLISGRAKEELLLTPLSKSHSLASQLQATTSGSIDSGIAGFSSSYPSANQTYSSQLEETGPHWTDPTNVTLLAQEKVQFSIWVSFFEIYNEQIYDLLDTTEFGSARKRPTLRLCEDQTGNPYVKDLNWINVQDAEEAWKLLKLGRKNQSFASNHMNEHSSRSHSIFSIRVLHLQENGSDPVPKISELSLCDLAGSERCKEQRVGDRMKEANNINTSLHTLGRCLTVLRQNQQSKSKQNVVPFRDSKLTRVFQGFFTGHGQSCMIVNINPCASSYNETLHVMKFSAIASQLIQAPAKVALRLNIQSLIKEHNIRTHKVPVEVPDQETEADEDSEDEANTYDTENLLHVIEAVQNLLLKERQEKLQLEVKLREEICNEMMEHLQQREKQNSENTDAQNDMLEDLYEDRLNNLKESLSDYYQEEIEIRDEKIQELEAALQESKQQKESLEKKLQNNLDATPLLRSKRGSNLQAQALQETKDKLEQCQAELSIATEELRKYRWMIEPPPSARQIAVDVDRKLEEGQKNVRMLRAELQKLGASLQTAERACCHTTGAGKLRETITTCDNILIKQNQTLAELQNNMMLVKLDMRKKAACIAEQYNTVQKLQAASTSSIRKRLGANDENLQPKSQPPVKKPFLPNFLTRSAARTGIRESPYSGILNSRRSPPFKTLPFGKKH